MTIDELLRKMRTPGCSEPNCFACESNRERAQKVIDDISRAAQIAVLREVQRSVQNRNEGAAWSIRIRDKIAALEKEGGA